MKWGQHIFGKERNSSGSKKKKKTAAQKARERAKKQQAKQEAKVAVQKKRIMSSPRTVRKYRQNLTAEEITQALEGFDWDARLADLDINRIARGRRVFQEIVSIGATAQVGWNVIASFANSLGGANLPTISPLQQIINSSGQSSKKKK